MNGTMKVNEINSQTRFCFNLTLN